MCKTEIFLNDDLFIVCTSEGRDILYTHVTSFLVVFFVVFFTWASDSSALMHSVGTHVEYTCKTKHKSALRTV